MSRIRCSECVGARVDSRAFCTDALHGYQRVTERLGKTFLKKFETDVDPCLGAQ